MNKMTLLEEYLKHNDQSIIEYYRNNRIARKMYSEVYRDVGAVIRYFESMAIGKKEKIGILSDNCYEYVVLDLACLLGGWHFVCFPKESFKQTVNEIGVKFNVRMLFVEDSLINGQGTSGISPISLITSVLDAPGESGIIACNQLGEEETFTTVFTSGSTGTPKSLEVRYKCPGHFIETCLERFALQGQDKMAVFLPLSQFSSRLYVYGAILGKFNLLLTTPDRLFFDLRLYRPTIMQAVPYFFESMYESMISQLRKSVRRRVVYLAFLTLNRYVGGEWLENAKKRVFREIHAYFGGNMRIMVTGAAPIRKEVLLFFNTIGIPLYEAYGLVETGLITLSYPGVQKIGSVGKILPDKSIEFDGEGQIIVRSNYFWGSFYTNVSEEMNNSIFRSDGCIATGDVGYVDNRGFLFLTGRLTDVIVLSNGNKIHPAEIEKKVNSLSLVKQSAVFGQGKPYPIAVVTTKEKGEVRAALKAEIKKLNRQLGIAEQIKGVVFADDHFTPKNEMLSQNLKLNRKKIYKAYEKEIEAMYATQ